MKRRLFSAILFFTLSTQTVEAQTGTYISLADAKQIPWKNFATDKRFIVTGEAHGVSCIFPFHFSQLKYLVATGLRNLVWEMPFSYCLISQEYLETGSDSLLKLLAYAQEDREYFKNVFLLNQQLAPGDRLHIWGIDHELGENSGARYRLKLYKKAFEILTIGKPNPPAILTKELESLAATNETKEATAIKKRLQQLGDHPDIVHYFGKDFVSFKVLVNRLDHYKVGRNDEMLDAFKEIFSLFQLDSNSRFLGRFGWGHINKSRKGSMSWYLENDPASPVRGSVFVVGVHYLNCSYTRAQEGFFENDGVVDQRSQRLALAAIDQKDPSPIKVFTWPEGEKKSGWANDADVLFLFSRSPGLTVLKQGE